MEYDDRERKWHNLQQEALEKRLVWLDEPPRLVVHSPSMCLLCCRSSAPAFDLLRVLHGASTNGTGRDGPAERKMCCSLPWFAT